MGDVGGQTIIKGSVAILAQHLWCTGSSSRRNLVFVALSFRNERRPSLTPKFLVSIWIWRGTKRNGPTGWFLKKSPVRPFYLNLKGCDFGIMFHFVLHVFLVLCTIFFGVKYTYVWQCWFSGFGIFSISRISCWWAPCTGNIPINGTRI